MRPSRWVLGGVVAVVAIAVGVVVVVPDGRLPIPPGGGLLVTSAYCHAVTALDAATLAPRWSVDVGREPRAVVASPDGARAFVTHLVGDAITVLDLDEEKPGLGLTVNEESLKRFTIIE